MPINQYNTQIGSFAIGQWSDIGDICHNRVGGWRASEGFGEFFHSDADPGPATLRLRPALRAAHAGGEFQPHAPLNPDVNLVARSRTWNQRGKRATRILVTAFGPFDGRPENASSLALAGLKQRFPWLNTRVLPVDSVVAPGRMVRAIRELRPSVVLMLGEAAGSSTPRLETTAWNSLDFRIPDIAGRQPRDVPIRPGSPEHLPATLPWDQVLALLAAAGMEARMSDDAGRYLCNQVMFHALDFIRRHGLATRAGFIHLPLATELPSERAVGILARVIRLLAKPATGAR